MSSAVNGSHDTAAEGEVYQDPCSTEFSRLVRFSDTWHLQFLIPNRQRLEQVLNFNLRPTDVIVASFPKSGTTWTQNIVLKMAALGPDSQRARDERNLEDRFPMIEYNHAGSTGNLYDKEGVRFLKSHMPYHLLPNDFKSGTGKLIYIARNPKDTAVSLYHYIKGIVTYNYTGDFEHLLEDFMSGKVMYGPWKNHVESYWTQRNNTNLLFLTYEQLKKSPLETVQQISKFLGWSLTLDQLKDVVKVTSFESMKEDNQANYQWYKDRGIRFQDADHLRKGVVGDWRNHMTEEMNARVEKELLDPLKKLGLTFEC